MLCIYINIYIMYTYIYIYNIYIYTNIKIYKYIEIHEEKYLFEIYKRAYKKQKV